MRLKYILGWIGVLLGLNILVGFAASTVAGCRKMSLWAVENH
jgi:hypothetical protein